MSSDYEFRINNVKHPDHWLHEGIAAPTEDCKKLTLEVCNHISKNYNLLPTIIASTVEEGIYLRFDRDTKNTKKSLTVEVYNNLEIAALVNDNSTKKILGFEDIKNLDFSRMINIL
jgi:hypothetical protein